MPHLAVPGMVVECTRGSLYFFTFKFSFMHSNENALLTPAQRNLITFISREDATTLYDSLSDTLSLALVNGANPGERFIPTPATLDSWYFLLQLMAHIHAIAAEPPAGAGSGEKEPPKKFGS